MLTPRYSAYKTTIALGLGALALFTYGILNLLKYDSPTPNREAIRVDKVGSYEITFTSLLSDLHELVLTTERKLEPAKQICMLGLWKVDKPVCEGNTSTLSIDWKIFEGKEIVVEGNSREPIGGIYSDQSTGILLSTFQATKGTTYRIEADVVQPGPGLSITNPYLEVSIDSTVREGILTWAALSVFASCLIAAVSVLIGLYKYWAKRRIQNR